MTYSALNLLLSQNYNWQLSWPITLPIMSLPLVGAMNVAMMGHLSDPSLIGGVGLKMLVFNLLYFGLSLLRMGTNALTARALGEGKRNVTKSLLPRGLMLAGPSGTVLLPIHPILIWLANIFFDANPTVERHMAHFMSVRIGRERCCSCIGYSPMDRIGSDAVDYLLTPNTISVHRKKILAHICYDTTAPERFVSAS